METESEVRTFRDKLGIGLASLGVASMMLAVMALIMWPFLPEVFRNVGMLISIELVLFPLGAILIKLSLLTVKKSSDNSR